MLLELMEKYNRGIENQTEKSTNVYWISFCHGNHRRSKFLDSYYSMGSFLPKQISIMSVYSREGNFLPVETAGSGCCRYLTVDWINSIMVKAYRNGLSAKDLFQLSNRDEGYFNAERFQRIWEEEVHEAKSCKNGPRQPSLAKCVWKFSRTRLILSSMFIMLSIVLQFIAPVRKISFLRIIWRKDKNIITIKFTKL